MDALPVNGSKGIKVPAMSQKRMPEPLQKVLSVFPVSGMMLAFYEFPAAAGQMFLAA